MTRIAASSPVMWENICESNKTQLLSLMDQYEANFHKLREIIADGSSQKMIDYFQDSKNYRDSLTLPGAKSARISTRYLSILPMRQAVLQCLQAF